MDTRQSPDSQARNQLVVEDAVQDQIISQRLPEWLRKASVDDVTATGEALRLSLYFRQRVSVELARIQRLDHFALPLLETALEDHVGAPVDAHRWTFRVGHREPVINPQPVGYHLTEVVYSETSLIEAALRNFTAEQTTEGGQPRGNRLLSARQGTIKPPSALAFAALCRTLDLGGQYQRHLDQVLNPAEIQGEPTPRFASLLARSQRYAMLVDTYVAKFQGALSDSEHQFLVKLCLLRQPTHLDGHPVIAKQLRLLGCMLEQIVVLEVIDEGVLLNSTRRVLVHIPGDPTGSWRAFKSLRHFANDLGKRLRTPQYQRFFSRFVRRRDSQRFFSSVIWGYDGVSDLANISLDEHLKPYPARLFDTLAATRIRQIKDDAAMIATPVADVDRQVQKEHDQRLAAEGWTLLNLAGFFVPALGAALLAVTVWEMLGEVYHAIEAWHEGDTSDALDHLINVAVDVAVVGATAAGVVVARRVWERSFVVDSLVPARLEDGSTKLWNQDLAPFHSAAPPPGAVADAQGIQRLGEHAWIEMDGQHYPVTEQATEGGWQLRARDGHAPELNDNGAGAWRLWSEQPAQWNDRYHLFRRLGTQYRALDEERIDQVMTAHDLRTDELRALHVMAQAPEAELFDSVMRFRLDQRIRHLISSLRSGVAVQDSSLLEQAQNLPGAQALPDQDLAALARNQRRLLFQRAYDALQDPDVPGIALLRRVFPSLHRGAAGDLLNAASAVDRQRLLDSGRVRLRLAESARASVLRIRLARVYEALVLDTPQTADLARVTLGLLKHLAGASAGIRWRLFEGSRQGPLLIATEEGAHDAGLIHNQGYFQLLDDEGAAIGEPGELFEVMANAYTHSQRDAMGVGEPFAHNLRVLLGRQAAGRREEVQQLLNRRANPQWFRPPQRLSDGRIGYPLSGRGPGQNPRRVRPQALPAMVRELYPTYSDAQVLAWADTVEASGRPIEGELVRLRQEFKTLTRHLRKWKKQASTPQIRSERRFVRDSLLNCWQRKATIGDNIAVPDVDYRLTLFAARPDGLPELPPQVSFAHVFELLIMNMDLHEVPLAFLQAFSNLRMLDLSGNRLSRVPPQLLQLPHLRDLELSNNQIILDAGQAATLASCETLEFINLSYNPLGRTFSTRGLSRLRQLNLRNTGISQLPNGLLDCPQLVLADLRDNHIADLPESFYQAPAWIRRIILLRGNPFPQAQAQRLQTALQAGDEVEDSAREVFVHPRQVWADTVDPRYRGALIVAWDKLENEERADRFFRVLRQLLWSEDFKRNAEAMAYRVLAMLRVMGENEGLREELFNVSNDEWGCQDGAAWCFSNLEVSVLVWRAQTNAQSNTQQSLLHLGLQLWRLDEVDRLAVQDILSRGGNPDQSEVGLAYRLGLRLPLQLPIETGDMSFRPVAGVSEQSIARARAHIEDAERDSLQVANSLIERNFWQAHLERSFAERFNRVDQPFQQRLADLLDDRSLSEGAQLLQTNALTDEQRAARRALLLELTLEAMEVAPGDPVVAEH